MLYKVVLTFEHGMKSHSVTIQMKVIEQYVLMMLLTFQYSTNRNSELFFSILNVASFLNSQITRSEQLSQQLQKELANVKQKNRNEVKRKHQI